MAIWKYIYIYNYIRNKLPQMRRGGRGESGRKEGRRDGVGGEVNSTQYPTTQRLLWCRRHGHSPGQKNTLITNTMELQLLMAPSFYQSLLVLIPVKVAVITADALALAPNLR